MWSFGLLTVFLGYALVYYGLENMRSGGQGPKFADVLGLPAVSLPGVTGKGRVIVR